MVSLLTVKFYNKTYRQKKLLTILVIFFFVPGEWFDDGGSNQWHPDNRLHHSGDSFGNFSSWNGMGSKGEFLKMILPTTASQLPEQIAGIEGTPYSKRIAIITFYDKRSQVSARWNTKPSKHEVQAVQLMWSGLCFAFDAIVTVTEPTRLLPSSHPGIPFQAGCECWSPQEMASVLGEKNRQKLSFPSEIQYSSSKFEGIRSPGTREYLDLTISKSVSKFLNDGEHVFCLLCNSQQWLVQLKLLCSYVPGGAITRHQVVTRNGKIAKASHLHKAIGNIPTWHLFPDYAFIH